VKPTDGDIFLDSPEKVRQRVWDSCVREGRICHRIGRRLEDCPRFKDPDMAASWCMGWRYADEERRRNR